MSRLFLLLFLLFTLPASAGLFDSASPGGASPFASASSNKFLPVSEAFKPGLLERDHQTLRIRFDNAPGYYLYRMRFKVESEPAGLLGEPQLPAGKVKHDEYFGEVEVYYDQLEFEIPTTRPAPEAFSLLLTWQGCADAGLCYPPETTRIEIQALDGAPATSGTTASSPAAAPTQHWRFTELALFFIAGLGLTFTPCVLPMLPILSGIVLRGQAGGLRGWILSSTYALAMALSFAVLGALMGKFGAELNLQARLQSPWVLVPFALFFTAFALSMFGLYELRLPEFLRQRIDQAAGHARGGSILGAALLGVLSSLLVSPCVSAPLAGALLYISSSGDAFGGGLKLFALGLGMGAPLVLFASGGGSLLPKSGNWMVAVRNTFGVLLLGVAVWMLERILPGPLALALWGLLAGGCAIWLGALEFVPKSPRARLAQLLGLALLVYALSAWTGALRGNSDPLRPLSGFASSAPAAVPHNQWQTITTPAQLDRELASARTAGQAVILDWYADWCISCKVIEREVFENPTVMPLLEGHRLLRFDITANTAGQRSLLDRYQLFGPPAVLFFDTSGEERLDLRVVGEVEAGHFAELLQRLNSAH